jgi:site-specific DNA recombinase
VVGPGKWKAIIDEDTHRGIVAYLSDPSRACNPGFERVHQGTNTYICGVCGKRLVAFSPAGGKQRAYACPDRHIRRQGEALDAFIDAIVVEYLSRTDIEKLIEPAGVDAALLHAQRTALRVRMDELASLFAEGAITAPQLKRGTAQLSTAVGSLEAELATATRSNPIAALVAGSHGRAKLEKRWATTSPDIRGKIIDQLLTVTVNRSPLGLRRFDPSYIDVKWKA